MERKLDMTRDLEYNIQDSLQQDLHREECNCLLLGLFTIQKLINKAD